MAAAEPVADPPVESPPAGPDRGPARASMLRLAAATAAGASCWTAFPPLSLWPLGFVAVAGMTLAVRGSRPRVAFGAGWLFGVGFFVPLLSFLRGLGIDAWLVPSAMEAVWFGLLAVALRVVVRLPRWPVAAATLWVGQEWLRDRWPFGGFPWGRLGFAQADGPLLPLAAWGGAPGLTFVAALLGSVLGWLVVSRRPSPRRAAVGIATAAVVAGLTVAVAVPVTGQTTGGPSNAVVAAIQGNVPRLGLDAFAQARTVTANHVAETEQLAAAVRAGEVPRPAAVIWPENASDVDPYADAQARSMIDAAVRAVGVPVLVGAVLDGPDDHVRNAAIVWSPETGPGEQYVKRHLVPFGEYLPFRAVLSRLVGRFSLIPHDFAPGTRPGVLRVGPLTVADAICFEVADDEVVRQAVDGGGRLLVVQTNNATYEHPGDDGDGGETAQQLEITRLRAVEHGRAAVVAATSGVSAVIGPDGTVRQRSGVFVPDYLVADLPLRDSRTVADRLGPWPERVVSALALVAVIAGMRRRRPSRSRGADAAEPALASAS